MENEFIKWFTLTLVKYKKKKKKKSSLVSKLRSRLQTRGKMQKKVCSLQSAILPSVFIIFTAGLRFAVCVLH